jgi:hypothetical protein
MRLDGGRGSPAAWRYLRVCAIIAGVVKQGTNVLMKRLVDN